MDAPDRALQGQDMPIIGRLYMAFELGEKSWKLSLGDGVRGPSCCAWPPVIHFRKPIVRSLAP
ncbi:hypothetical protein WL28_06230 [Burkholderia ubonensis]|nr:hypothetical protein WI78_11800 [Burkholderia ubonensis]KWA74906.1 hypothetical protein WL28_06230 [Burkholderia ubonensis]